MSRTAGREGERFVSPGEQRERIEAACERDGLQLVAVHEELDVSGGKALAERPGLSAAVEAIEAGSAEVVAAAYFDRLFRSLGTQSEVVERVERAGGQVLAVDIGRVTGESASQWLSGTMMGAVSEYFRRSVGERAARGQAQAVARGATPWARVPLGYTRDNGVLSLDPETVPLVQRVFQMRLEGRSTSRIRAMLKSHGVERSPRGVQVMLASRVYLGEVHFGELVNLEAHESIIDRDTFERVQRMVVPRGRQPKSDRLLARLGVLHCGSCGARLCAMRLPRQGNYPAYRCPSSSDCACHVTISAEIAEQVITDAVRAALRDVEGRASVQASVRDAELALARSDEALSAAVEAFTGFEDVADTRRRLAELRAQRDEAQALLDQLGGTGAALSINTADDWDRLTLDERRDLIRATIKVASVAPVGRKAPRPTIEQSRQRITVELFGE